MVKLRTALLVATAALAGVPALASAQTPPQQQGNDRHDHDRDDHNGGNHNGGDHNGGDHNNGGGHRGGGGGQPQGQPPAPAPAPSGRGGDQPGNRWGPNAPGGQGGYAGRGPDHPGGDRWGPNAPGGQGGYAGRGPGWDRGPGPGAPGWDRGPGPGAPGWDRRPGPGGAWRNDPRYNWHGWRDQHREVFRVGRYVPPRGFGFGYRVFAPGYRLQPYFYDRSYWIADPWVYRLPPADGPYRWVRYYNDVLLVDLRSGYVADVIRDFFW